jgi:hypothetical protein
MIYSGRFLNDNSFAINTDRIFKYSPDSQLKREQFEYVISSDRKKVESISRKKGSYFSNSVSPENLEIDSSIDGCLRTNLKTGYAVSGIEFNDRMMFIHDGNPYLITTSTITYSHDSDNEQLTTMVRTVTGEQ